MKKQISIFLLSSLLSVTIFAQEATFQWAKQFGGTGSDAGLCVTVDASGNVYTTGWFTGTVDFDPSAGIYNLTGAGTYNIFISKLDALGNFVWAKQFSDATNGEGLSIAVDVSGNVYTTGIFNGTVDFNPGAGTYNLTSIGNPDVFISKLDASGNFVWAKQMGGSGNSAQGNSITVDISGNVYTTGYFSGTVDFDPSASTFNLNGGGGFISKLDASGNFVWAKKWGSGSFNSVGSSIVIDALGNVYTTGYFSGTADFDPGTSIYNLTSAGGNDIFISKLNASGNFVWAKQIGEAYEDIGNCITIDDHGYIYATGCFNGTADFDPGTGIFNLTSAGSNDIFISKLDTSGNFVWAKQLGGTSGSDQGKSIAVDSSGNVYATGWFGGTADFDPGISTYNLTSVGSSDIFLSKLDALGIFVWAKQLGSASADGGSSISVDATENIYTTGSFSGTVDFDPNTSTYNLTSAGSTDIFVHKMSLCTIANITLQPPVNQTICKEGSANFSITAAGTGTLSYQWKYYNGTWNNVVNGTPTGATYSNQSTATMTVSGISNAGNYQYQCYVSNVCGNTTSNNANLIVNIIPDAAGIITGNTPICQGQNNIIYSVSSIANATSYIWTLPGGSTGSSTTNSITVNYGTSAVSGNITVKGNNLCGDGTLSSLAVTVDTLPSITGIISGTTPVCQGQNSITYTVPTTANATSYIWTLSSGTTGTSTTNSIIVNYGTSAVSGNITVKGHNNCGDGTSSSLYITVVPQPNAFAGNDTIICNGSSIILTATGGNSYVWNNGVTQGTPFSPTSTNSYIVSVSNGFCSNTDTIIVNVANPPSAPVIYQVGNVLNSTASTSNQWYNDLGIILGATGQTYTPTVTSHYYVFFTDNNGCISDTSNVLYVIVTGISNSINNKNLINIYPNPVTNELIIDSKEIKGNPSFEILNSIGQIMFKGNLTEKTIVKTTNFVSGIYFIKLDNGKTFEFKKIIKE